jgi:hypothetical protein
MIAGGKKKPSKKITLNYAEILADPIKTLAANKSRPGYASGLEDIIEHAIRLDLDMKSQIADYYVPKGSNGTDVSFDPQSMSDELSRDSEQDSGVNGRLYVNMFLAPSLRRRGDSEGTEYDQEKVVHKAKVRVRPSGPLRVLSPK